MSKQTNKLLIWWYQKEGITIKKAKQRWSSMLQNERTALRREFATFKKNRDIVTKERLGK